MKIFKSYSSVFPKYLEYIGQRNYRFRWNINSENDNTYSYYEAEMNYKASITEIKQIISDWVKATFNPSEFYIENINYWRSSNDRASLKLKCESNPNILVSLVTDNNIIELDSKNINSLLFIMSDYEEDYKLVIDKFIMLLNSCKTIEEINLLDFNLKLPEVIYLTKELLNKAAEVHDKENITLQAVLFAKMTINSLNLSDTQALKVKKLYPEWKDFIRKSLNMGLRVLHKNRLYNIRLDILEVLANLEPSIYTASLYEEINEINSGTIDNPIPYNNNMELEVGKYYILDGITYICNRGTGLAVYSNLRDLIGIYVNKV